jgi:HSP20 family protein
MDAWRSGDVFHIEFDLPGVSTESIDLDVERNVLTVRAERGQPTDGSSNGNGNGSEMIAAERPRGVFSRQVILGDNLNLDAVEASYRDGVLHLTIPVAERAKPRKISIDSSASNDNKVITAS